MTSPEDSPHQERTDEIERIGAELRALLDTDPAEAILRARLTRFDGVVDRNVEVLQAGIFIDAGAALGLPDLVHEGVELLKRHEGTAADKGDVTYNIANGLRALADLDVRPSLEWFLATRGTRREAREKFSQAAERTRVDAPSLATQALTNLGNALLRASRWCEALDAFSDALRVDPSNGVAAGQMTHLLHRLAHRRVSDPELLVELAGSYARVAQENSDVVKRIAGEAAVRYYARFPANAAPLPRSPVDLAPRERFVADHRLALVPLSEAVAWSKRCYDTVHISSIVEPVKGGDPRVPPAFAMFNVLKADYLLARDLAFAAHADDTRDTGSYMDTLDYATYGRTSARWRLAQRAAFDLLDRVASLLNQYLELGLPPHKADFDTIWVQRGSEVRWRPQILAAMAEQPRDVQNASM